MSATVTTGGAGERASWEALVKRCCQAQREDERFNTPETGQEALRLRNEVMAARSALARPVEPGGAVATIAALIASIARNAPQALAVAILADAKVAHPTPPPPAGANVAQLREQVKQLFLPDYASGTMQMHERDARLDALLATHVAGEV